MKEIKIYHKVLRIEGRKNHFIEAGTIENPNKYGDDIYFMISGTTTKNCWELRTDETLALISILSLAVNNKITGLTFQKKKIIIPPPKKIIKMKNKNQTKYAKRNLQKKN